MFSNSHASPSPIAPSLGIGKTHGIGQGSQRTWKGVLKCAES
jgi:hypothetical protein